MKLCTYLTLVLLVTVVAGCENAGNRSVTEGVDQQAIAEYEAELAKVTAEDIPEEKE